MNKPKVLVLRTAGTNCDKETAFAFKLAGGASELVHINEFIFGRKKMSGYQIMAIPGGFSYGDDIASGKILANELRFKLANQVRKFISDGKLIIGICNGFQVLVKSGFLAGATLTFNDSGRFQDEWVYLRVCHSEGAAKRRPKNLTSTLDSSATSWPQNDKVPCIWTQNLPEKIYLPIAHGEGKFAPKDEETLKKLWENGQVVLQYVNNRNGSVDNIAGMCDPTGRIFGLMPHPERYVSWEQHPRRNCHSEEAPKGRPKNLSSKKEILRRPAFGGTPQNDSECGDGLQIFRNAVEYAKNNL